MLILTLLTNADTLLKARADVKAFKGNISGEVWFYQLSDMSVFIRGTIRGLDKDKTYAIHIHEFGDCSSHHASGGHFDPYKSEKHAHPDDPIGTHHSGDLPNIKSDKNGIAEFTYKTKAFTLLPSPYSILGRSVIIHAGEDDYKSQPAGNSGDRIACGIIGLVK
ncbi:MAG: superoxide dismutase family protein [candidate division WOR-3 bacterium]